MRLVIDARERALIRLFSEITVRTLEVGDVRCEYDDGNAWIAERKTADDLAASIKDGRWSEQKERLIQSGKQIVYIIEGELRNVKFTFDSLLGACVNTVVRDGLMLFRTSDIYETKHLIEQLVKKMAPYVGQTIDTLGTTSKRKRDNDLETIWLRQLMTIPTISEPIARAILKHFGTMSELRAALLDIKRFPNVRLTPDRFLGKARIMKLASIFV